MAQAKKASGTAAKKTSANKAAPAARTTARRAGAGKPAAKAPTKTATRAATKTAARTATKAATKGAPARSATAKAAPARGRAKTATKTAPAKTATKREPARTASKAAPAKGPSPKAAPAKGTAKPAPTKAAPAPGKAAKAPAPPKPKADNRLKDPKFFAEQKDLLLEERADHVAQADALKAEAEQMVQEMEPGDIQFDEESGEGGSVNLDRERDLLLSAQARQAVDEIDHALAKIADGSYGLCENCGQPILKARLKALPHARLCVACKSGGLSRR